MCRTVSNLESDTSFSAVDETVLLADRETDLFQKLHQKLPFLLSVSSETGEKKKNPVSPLKLFLTTFVQ